MGGHKAQTPILHKFSKLVISWNVEQCRLWKLASTEAVLKQTAREVMTIHAVNRSELSADHFRFGPGARKS